MAEFNDIKTMLLEIKEELSSLKSTSIKNHEDLKTEFLSFKSSMVSQVRAIDMALKNVVTDQDSLKSEVTSVTKSQDFISKQYESMKNTNTNLIKKNQNLEKENIILNKKINDQDTAIKANILSINNHEQYTRREMVEINGLPQVENENTPNLVHTLMNHLKIKIDMKKESLDVIHRLSDRTDAPIIIKFTSRSERDLFFSYRSNLKTSTIKDLGFPLNPNNKSNKIFINESLTRTNKLLFKKTREECKKKEFQFTWTKNGVVFARKNNDSHAIRINQEDDIKKIR